MSGKKKNFKGKKYSYTNAEYGYTFCPTHQHFKHKDVCEVCNERDECLKKKKNKIRGG